MNYRKQSDVSFCFCLNIKIEDRNAAQPKKEQCFPNNFVSDEDSKRKSMKQLTIIDGQHRDIKVRYRCTFGLFFFHIYI